MKITGKAEGATNEKRFYVPGVMLTEACPVCGRDCHLDLSERYLSYPEFGEPCLVSFYCDPCNINTERHIRLVVTVEEVPR